LLKYREGRRSVASVPPRGLAGWTVRLWRTGPRLAASTMVLVPPGGDDHKGEHALVAAARRAADDRSRFR
jgi:hypothetical protein